MDLAARLAALKQAFVAPPTIELKRGPKGTPLPERVRSKNRRETKSMQRKRDVAVLDMETDKFDNKQPDIKIRPFVACIYSLEFDPIIIWEDDFEAFKKKVVSAITNLPRRFTIYAHNGGKFDWMFLISELRGEVSFKGRGIMSARIGEHEIRDSMHIIPEALANFKKNKFDYSKNDRDKRHKHRAEILEYLVSDCAYLLEIVLHMVNAYGLKISIGQMATYELRKNYKIAHLAEGADTYIRKYFYGGRVECLQGAGHWRQPLKLYDVNSMYPRVMAEYAHPIGASFDLTSRIGPNTIFIELTCRNRGALIAKDENNATTAGVPFGRFKTTIWEYEVARKHGLISDIEIHHCIDFEKRSAFPLFVNPLYDKRLLTKERMKEYKSGFEYDEAKKDDMLLKYILNNSWGKQAQNPRNYKAHFMCGPGEKPPREWFPIVDGYVKESLAAYQCSQYAVFQKPNPSFRFNNVACGASITGAARSVLLDAIQAADNPIYCDTDSLICSNLEGVEIHPTKLGAWDLEKEIDEIIICGKKLYAYRAKGTAPVVVQGGLDPAVTIRSKGVNGLVWSDFEKMIYDRGIIPTVNKAPTMTRNGLHRYMPRDVRATAQFIRPLNFTPEQRVSA